MKKMSALINHKKLSTNRRKKKESRKFKDLNVIYFIINAKQTFNKYLIF